MDFATILHHGLHQECWPTNDDIMHYYISHVNYGTHDKYVVTTNLAQFVSNVWEKGNGWPLTKKAIIPRFDKLYIIYHRKGEGGALKKGHHRKKKTNDPHLQPIRKSARLAGIDISTKPDSPNLPERHNESELVKKKPVSRSSKCVPPANPSKEEWMEDNGSKLFDVLSKVFLLVSLTYILGCYLYVSQERFH